MVQLLDRQRFVHTLGVAGLGVGLLASAAGAPAALAQANQPPGIDRPLFQEEGTLDLSDEALRQLLIQLLQEKLGDDEGVLAFRGEEDGKDVDARPHGGDRGDHDALRVEVYKEFTQTLADELGIDDPDEVDAAIRGAMMAGVDANDGLTKDAKEELKALITDAEAPIGPTIRGWGG